MSLSVIDGIKKIGQRTVQHGVPEDARMRVFITNIDFEGGRSEPSLVIGRRTFGRGRSVVIPLSRAHQYNDPNFLPEKIFNAANVLFDQPTRAEYMRVGDVILRHLPELFTHAPEAMETRAQWENRMSRVGLKVEDGNGNVLMDFSEH